MISIITPTYKNSSAYIGEAYQSLLNQTFQEWEWVVVLNNGGFVTEEMAADERVNVVDVGNNFGDNVGKLKKLACEACKFPYILELDADDLLVPTTLEKVVAQFDNNPKAMFVYSNNAHFDEEGKSTRFGSAYGWEHEEVEVPFPDGSTKKLWTNISWEASVHCLRRIEWSPDHLRAWRKEAYNYIGGHNTEIKLGDDHDLMCRFYIAFGAIGFSYIKEVLYLYRKHGNNTSVVQNQGVQQQVAQNYAFYIEAMVHRWANDVGLPAYDLGGGLNPAPGFLSVDVRDTADIKADLNDRFPFEDNSVGVLRAHHIFEHLKDPIHTMNECYRVLAPGGILLIEVPSTDGRGAFCDPTHISFWNERSFAYYTEAQTANFIRPQYKGRFQSFRIATVYPNQWWFDNMMPVVRAELCALKPGYDRPPGAVLI